MTNKRHKRVIYIRGKKTKAKHRNQIKKKMKYFLLKKKKIKERLRSSKNKNLFDLLLKQFFSSFYVQIKLPIL